MQLGLWHLTFPKDRVFRRLSAADFLSLSMAMVFSFLSPAILKQVHHNEQSDDDNTVTK
jgi:hypothetical protein